MDMKNLNALGACVLFLALSSSLSFADGRVSVDSLNPDLRGNGLHVAVFSDVLPKVNNGTMTPISSISAEQVPFVEKQLQALAAAINLKPELLAKLKKEHRNIAIMVMDISKQKTDKEIDQSDMGHVNLVDQSDGMHYLSITVFAGRHTASTASSEEILQGANIADVCNPSKDMGLGCYGDVQSNLTKLQEALDSKQSIKAFVSTGLKQQAPADAAARRLRLRLSLRAAR